MTWVNNLKIAVIEEDMEAISIALDEIPDFKDLDKAKEALSLVQTATVLAKREKQQILENMNKIKQTKKFLEH
ncbi:MAG: hypothetical protein QM482_01630 [Sulfurospirillum sp.]